jgi:hypothetical protein
MPRSRRVALDDALDPGSFRFLVLELAFRNERDLPGLLRHRLGLLLPRGLEGMRFCFRRIGRAGRLLVTLIKEPVPASFVPARTALPFPLRIADRGARGIAWISRNATYLARYEGGLLASVEGEGAPSEERREASTAGPSVQEAVGGTNAAWRAAAAALGVALASRLALEAARAIGTRADELDSLDARISELTALGCDESERARARDLGLQSRADEIQGGVTSRWRKGYYLTKWSLAGDTLRIEGWGPDALALLASLRIDPALSGLELASMAEEKDYEVFAFEGKVADD